MFTGIVQGIGKVESLRAGTGGTRRLTVKTELEVGNPSDGDEASELDTRITFPNLSRFRHGFL